MTLAIDLCEHVQGLLATPLAAWRHVPAWELVAQVPQVVRTLMATLAAGDYVIDGDLAIHHSAAVEAGAMLKGPLIVGPGCSLLREPTCAAATGWTPAAPSGRGWS